MGQRIRIGALLIMIILPSTRKLVDSMIKQMGLYAFVGHCKNLGIPFEDVYIFIFNRELS